MSQLSSVDHANFRRIAPRRLLSSKVPIALVILLLAGFASANSELRHLAIEHLRSIAEPLLGQGAATDPRFDRFYAGMVEALPPQPRVERALELAVNQFEGAPDYILAQASNWHGDVEPTPRLDTLITTAINSPRIEVRMAGLEVYLAQYALEKTPEQVDRLLDRLIGDPEGAGPWALWSMSAIGARGIDRERVFTILLEYAAATEEDAVLRRWAVDSLAKLGGAEVVDPLLDIAASDAPSIVRERAFCGVAQSGMLHVAERYLAIPRLLDIAEDPNQSRQAKRWAFQALREISSIYDLPEESPLWRDRLTQIELL